MSLFMVSQSSFLLFWFSLIVRKQYHAFWPCCFWNMPGLSHPRDVELTSDLDTFPPPVWVVNSISSHESSLKDPFTASPLPHYLSKLDSQTTLH